MKRANIMVGVMSSMRLTLLVFYGFISPLVECQTVPVQEISTTAAANENQEPEISPFLVLGVGETLYSLPYTWPEVPDQTNALVELYTTGGFWHSITAISYHYRRRVIFWSTTDGSVRSGSFMNRTQLNNVKQMQVITGGTFFDFRYIGDIAVDWIANRVYWTIRDEGKIEELDLETEQRRIVLQSEGKGVFSGLAIYPYPNNGWVYWTDREAGTIERVALTGEGRQAQLVRGNLGKCTWPLELDYSMQTLYWVDTCRNALRSLQISDSDLSVDTVAVQSSLSGTNSMTLFENVLYWNEQTTIKATNKSIESGDVVQIFTSSLPVVVELVHPGKQPQEEELIEMINENVDMETLQEICPPCINGHCIPLGVCACDRGWTGDNCTTDIDECNLARDVGCEYECHNTIGSFYCSCNSSSYLDSDGRTCVLGSLTTTYVIDPTVSTSTGMGIGPEKTPPGDHEYTSTSLLTNAGPIHSRTIMVSDTLLPVLPSHFAAVLPSSSTATTNTASGTPIREMYSTSQPPFLPESHTTSHTTSTSEPIFLPKSTTADSSFPPKSTADSTFLPKSTSTKSEPNSLFPKSTSLVSPQSSGKLSSSIMVHGITASPTMTSRLPLSNLPNSTTTISSSSADELHKTTSTYHIDNSITDTVSEQAGIAPSTTTVGLISSFSTAAVLLLPSSTSHMASLAATASPTPSSGLSTSSTVLPVISSSPLPSLPTSTTYAIRSSFTLSSMVSGPLETPTTASETTQSDTDSSTDPATEAQPPSNGMTLIIIAAASAGACVLLIIVVIIMIAAVVHYASKRCGSYTVNPDPEKKSNGAPSWISVVQSSPSAPATNHANGHSIGQSYRTNSFRASSPTCSTHSFT